MSMSKPLCVIMCLSCAYRMETIDTMEESALLEHRQMAGMCLESTPKAPHVGEAYLLKP